MQTIVVGVDGSHGAEAALRFAVGEARLRGATLRAVHAWTLPPVLATSGMAPPRTPGYLEQLAADAERLLDRALGEITNGGPHVERVVVRGAPVRVLLEAAEGADLLVVGSRGRGGFAGLLLGSVSQQCAQHAPCPIVIVRPHQQ
jgi:nucleotide-binding universal stress UspA family protein